MMPGNAAARAGEVLAGPDAGLLAFVADMGAVQLDQLAALLASRGEPAGTAERQAASLVAGWRSSGYVHCEELTIGKPWVWALRPLLEARGLPAKQIRPHPGQLRHTHAITDLRIAIERVASYRQGRASWVSERHLRSRLGAPARRDHLPDGEVCWPPDGGVPWAGECWAVEVELTAKTIERTTAIMREVLTRTGDYGVPAERVTVAGLPPRHARLIYACSRRALSRARNARAGLDPPLGCRVDIYRLPEQSMTLNTPKNARRSHDLAG